MSTRNSSATGRGSSFGGLGFSRRLLFGCRRSHGTGGNFGRLRGERSALFGRHDRHAGFKRVEAHGLNSRISLALKLRVDLLALVNRQLTLRDERIYQVFRLLARNGHGANACQENVFETITDRSHNSLPFFETAPDTRALSYHDALLRREGQRLLPT